MLISAAPAGCWELQNVLLRSNVTIFKLSRDIRLNLLQDGWWEIVLQIIQFSTQNAKWCRDEQSLQRCREKRFPGCWFSIQHLLSRSTVIISAVSCAPLSAGQAACWCYSVLLTVMELPPPNLTVVPKELFQRPHRIRLSVRLPGNEEFSAWAAAVEPLILWYSWDILVITASLQHREPQAQKALNTWCNCEEGLHAILPETNNITVGNCENNV